MYVIFCSTNCTYNMFEKMNTAAKVMVINSKPLGLNTHQSTNCSEISYLL